MPASLCRRSLASSSSVRTWSFTRLHMTADCVGGAVDRRHRRRRHGGTAAARPVRRPDQLRRPADRRARAAEPSALPRQPRSGRPGRARPVRRPGTPPQPAARAQHAPPCSAARARRRRGRARSREPHALGPTSLTKETGPVGREPAGRFNFDSQPAEHVLYVESCPRHVRVLLGEQLVADSHQVLLLHPPQRTPTYLLPPAVARADLRLVDKWHRLCLARHVRAPQPELRRVEREHVHLTDPHSAAFVHQLRADTAVESRIGRAWRRSPPTA